MKTFLLNISIPLVVFALLIAVAVGTAMRLPAPDDAAGHAAHKPSATQPALPRGRS